MHRLSVVVSAAAFCGLSLAGFGGEGIARWTNTVDATAAWTKVLYWTDGSGVGLTEPPLDGETVQLADMPAVPAGGQGQANTDGTFPTFQKLHTGQSATSSSAQHAGEVNPILASVTGDERHTIQIDTLQGSGAFYYPTGQPIYGPDGAKGRWFDVQDPNGFYGFWYPLGAVARLFLTSTESFTPVLHNLYTGQRPVLTVRGNYESEVGHTISGGAMEKLGPGRLTVTTTDDDGLRVYLKEGSLGIAGRRDSDLATILAKAAVHLDASAADTIVKGTSADGATVTAWYDVRGRTDRYYAAHDPYDGTAYANKIPYANDPLFASAVSPTGLDMVDFGIKGESSAGRKYCTMKLFPERLDGIRAVFYVAEHRCGLANTAVIGDHEKLEWLAGSKDSILYDTIYSAPVVRYGDITVNRRRVANFASVDAGTFSNLHVLAQSTLGGAGFGFLCTRQHYVSSTGGTRLGEVIVFTNELTNVERARVAAYLDAKWRTGSVADIDSVSIPYDKSNLALAVPEGRSATVGTVVAQKGFVKEGDGELRVGDLSPATAPITVQAGSVAFDATDADADAGETAAAGAYLWLDATHVADDGKVAEDETTYVLNWKDRRDGVSLAATSYETTSPHMPRLVESPLCGRTVLDFGKWNTSGTAYLTGNDGAWMKLPNFSSQLSHGAYHYFCVLRLKNESVDPSKGRKYDALPVIWGNSMDVYAYGASPLSNDYTPGVTSAARWCVNGVPIDPLNDNTLTGAAATNGFAVLSIASSVPWHCDEICHERDTSGVRYYCGGFEVGELILFDRRISRAAHRNIEAYLMEKWLKEPHPSAAARNPTLAFAATADMVLATETALDVASLSGGNGSLVKRGDGAATAALGWGSLSSVTVEAGDLALTVTNPPAASFLNDALFRFDASDARSFKTYTVDSDGVTNLASWADVRGNGLTADAVRNDYAKADPTVVSVETRSGVWRPTVDFGGYSGRFYVTATGSDVNTPVSSETSARMDLSTSQGSVKDAYIVYSDRPGEKRAWIFGSVHYYIRNVADGNGAIFQAYKDNPTPYAPSMLRDNAVVDGVAYSRTTVLPAGFHTIAVANNVGNTSVIAAFAGGSATGADSSTGAADKRTAAFAGGCRISEALAFNRILSTDERAYLTAYLDYKWFEKGTAPAPLVTNVLSSVSVAAGSTLSLTLPYTDVERLEIRSLSGGGTLEADRVDGIRALGVTVADGACRMLTVAGTAAFDESVAVTFDGDLRELAVGEYPFFVADGLENVDLTKWTISNDVSRLRRPVNLYRRGNVIGLRVQSVGFAIFFR